MNVRRGTGRRPEPAPSGNKVNDIGDPGPVEAARGGAPAGGRRGLPTLAVVVAVHAACVATIAFLVWEFDAPPRLIPIDGLSLPGAPAVIGARLHSDGALGRSRIRGVEVRFEALPEPGRGPQDRTFLERAETDANGTAIVSAKAPDLAEVLRFRASAEVSTPTGRRVATADVVLESTPREGRALLIVKVPDAVSEELEKEEPPAGAAEKISPAAEVLRDLARGAAVAYWVGPVWKDAADLRGRLERRGFPPGPLLGLDLPSARAGFGERMAMLHLERFRVSKWVVLKNRAEAREFSYRGVRALVLGGAAGGEAEEPRVYPVRNWNEVRDRVLERR
ncbi:MAG: hypothetical protein ACUVYA_15085 [Planctomycetota bacterium]